MYITTFNISPDLGFEVHFLKKSLIAYLNTDKAFIKVLSKYANFGDVFC